MNYDIYTQLLVEMQGVAQRCCWLLIAGGLMLGLTAYQSNDTGWKAVNYTGSAGLLLMGATGAENKRQQITAQRKALKDINEQVMVQNIFMQE